MLSSDIAVSVQNLSKRYEIYKSPSDRLKQLVLPRIKRAFGIAPSCFYEEFWALKGVSFDVKKGETIGIVGQNGSGKSTLLQIICGTITPTEGRVITRGRIAALLELGSGFNPEFSGRENVFMNAAILGLGKEEIESRFDSIAAFADIGRFLDQPVKNYSSGMLVRLAFAVQSQIDPDILVVDEALSVGDARFQAKCFERLRQLKESGTSVLLVTHSSEQVVTHCGSAVLLNNGVQIEHGEPKHVVNRYVDMLFDSNQDDEPLEERIPSVSEGKVEADCDYAIDLTHDVFDTRPNYNEHEYRWGDRKALILDYFFSSEGQSYPRTVSSGSSVTLALSIQYLKTLEDLIYGVTVKNREGVTVYGTNSGLLNCVMNDGVGSTGTVTVVETSFICRLAPGDYFISLGVASRDGEDVIPHDRRYDSIYFQVPNECQFSGLVDLELSMKVKEIVV